MFKGDNSLYRGGRFYKLVHPYNALSGFLPYMPLMVLRKERTKKTKTKRKGLETKNMKDLL